jgi:hypothetical protein
VNVFDLGQLGRFMSTGVEYGRGEPTIAQTGQQMRPARPRSPDDERCAAHLGAGWVINLVMCGIVAV